MIRIPVKPGAALLLIAATATASAGTFEVSFVGGWTAPTYEQRFQYDLDIDLPSLPGVDIRQQGGFQLDARGGFAFGGSATYYVNDHIGIEGRVDTVDFKVDALAPRFTATVELPAPLPPLSAELGLSRGKVEVDRLFPLSINLRGRTSGRTRFAASGGLSYLPRLRAEVSQTVGLGVTGLGSFGRLDIATMEFLAEALPDEQDEGRFGFNAGAGVEIQLSDKLAVTGEARFFRFQRVTFHWRPARGPAHPLEALLLEELEGQLSPVEIAPIYFQATGGIAIRF